MREMGDGGNRELVVVHLFVRDLRQTACRARPSSSPLAFLASIIPSARSSLLRRRAVRQKAVRFEQNWGDLVLGTIKFVLLRALRASYISTSIDGRR
jgi:hypothetical protein